MLFAECARALRLARRLIPEIFGGNRRGTSPENSHEMRMAAHEMRQAWRPKPASASPSPRSSRGEGLGGGLLSANSQNEVPAVGPPHPEFPRFENFELPPPPGPRVR